MRRASQQLESPTWEYLITVLSMQLLIDENTSEGWDSGLLALKAACQVHCRQIQLIVFSLMRIKSLGLTFPHFIW